MSLMLQDQLQLGSCPGCSPTSQCFAERQDLVSASVNSCDYIDFLVFEEIVDLFFWSKWWGTTHNCFFWSWNFLILLEHGLNVYWLRTPGVRQSLAETLERQPWCWSSNRGSFKISVIKPMKRETAKKLKAWASRHSLLMLCLCSFQEVLQLRDKMNLSLAKTPEFADTPIHVFLRLFPFATACCCLSVTGGCWKAWASGFYQPAIVLMMMGGEHSQWCLLMTSLRRRITK